jgi:hypothetical protein
MRKTEIVYDASNNVEYWGKQIATGQYQVTRYYYDASDNMVAIKDGRLGSSNKNSWPDLNWD